MMRPSQTLCTLSELKSLILSSGQRLIHVYGTRQLILFNSKRPQSIPFETHAGRVVFQEHFVKPLGRYSKKKKKNMFTVYGQRHLCPKTPKRVISYFIERGGITERSAR